MACPDTARFPRVPTVVILACAAVVNVPVILVPDKLPPVMLPVAEINPPVNKLPPITLPVAESEVEESEMLILP